MKNQYENKINTAENFKIYHGKNPANRQVLSVGVGKYMTFKRIKNKHAYIVDWQIPENPSPMYA